MDEVVAAARELANAGRWERALALLDAAVVDPPERAALDLAAAEVALAGEWFAGSDAGERLAACGPESGWRLDFLRVQYDYFQLLHAEDELRLGPWGKDPAAIADLGRRAVALRERADDDNQRGWAEMCLGWIADNLRAERQVAPAHYEAALAVAGRDGLLAREALRHLGDHDYDDGDFDGARHRWERATELGAAAGAVPGTLSQQFLLAALHRRTGDEAGAQALATEVARWSAAIGATRLHARVTAFLAGADPLAEPEHD
ncbi:hypothetical protein Ato02nite_064310 [Paractinoplanes toevensis]|uniref:Tetratricopeptide repeat protein n=1 Tax=Paractinoplanes toevensis TaxID=571911 RepID=A0A919W7A5_9ACTN|nr:hypothetical protein Ato02nite_064310 [Actinoplanes toevensis]